MSMAHETRAERLARGKALRQKTPRSTHAHWEPAPNRLAPVALLEASNQGRLPELIPIRHGRMLASPFAFFRGSAAAMAFDLAATPTSGIHLQLCGDCHLMNFGGFATPERHFIFDLTDFDETLPGPWEWDVKRLAASVVLAGRSVGISKRNCQEAALACLRSYRRRMSELAALDTLDVWYARVDGQALLDVIGDRGSNNRKTPGDQVAHAHAAEHWIPRIIEEVDGGQRFRDNPPLIYHPPHGDEFQSDVRRFLAHYRETLQDDRRKLLSRYELVDLAMKVVGVGSVGMRCAILLMTAGNHDTLILQYKEAGPSVLEPFAGKSRFRTHGHRVVCGQRLLQSASDLFLGWSTDEEKRDFYFRQLRDLKTSVRIDRMSASQLIDYAELCGWALARAHAKSGDPALISGYLGRGDAFDQAVAAFAHSYADQTESDHAALAQAVQEGRVKAAPISAS